MRRIYALLITSILALVGLSVAPASSVQDVTHDRVVHQNPDNATPHVLDGEVNALAEVGQWIVVGGSFTQVQAANGGPVLNRRSIFAFNKSTGAISTTFVPQVDGVVKGLADGPNNTVYVGGSFNNLNGANAYKVTQVNINNGTKVAAFQPGLTNSIVQDVRFVAGRLFIGGSFTRVQGEVRNRLAELNPTTGAVLARTNVSFDGAHWGGNTQIYHMDVSPDGSKLVAVGNFTTVAGQDRVEAAVVDIGGQTSTLSSWQTDRYEPRCYNVFDFIVRDVEFSPDGEYFVIGTTGGYGPGSPSLCDTATRWESDATGAGQNPTWIDYTGGDSLYSVAVTGSAVYVGGHNRWMNNPSRADAEGPGALDRSGIAALDPVNGLPLTWNPGRTRGQGVFDMLATAEGLFIGSDTERVNGEYHGRLAFFPLAGGRVVPQPAPPSLPADIYSLGTIGSSPTLYRVNAGGGTLASLDGGPDWLGDDGATNPYRNTGSNTAGWSAVPSVDGSVPSSTPSAVFSSERWDPDGSPEMSWDFPVASGTDIQVRLFLSNRCTCTDEPGERVFNASIDGQPKLTSYDISADVGHDVATMKSFNVTSDGNVDIDFGHVVENPLVNGIEIVNLNAPPAPPEDSATKRSFNGSSLGASTPVSSPGINWSQARGAVALDGSLYTAWADGHLYKRSFDGGQFGAAQDVDLHGLTNFASEMQSMTGMFYDHGRLYYTRSGSSRLEMRYFTVESDVVGAGLRDLQPFTVANNLSDVDWTDVRGMFLAGNRLYWSDRTDGTLHRIDWVDGQPVDGTDSVVSGPSVDGIDWRQHALFAFPTQPNDPPNAVLNSSCSGLSCSFNSGNSTDPDGSISSRTWSFGDGDTSNEVAPDHTYDLAGTYQVSLTVTDNDGDSDTATRTVEVSEAPQNDIGFVASARDTQDGSVSNHRLTVPAGVEAGDAMVMFFSDNAPAQTISTPAGWTQIGTESTSGMTTRIWSRTATAADAGSQLTVTTGTAARGDLVLSAYEGAQAPAPADAATAAETVSRVGHTTPTVSVSESGSWLVSYWADKTAGTTAWTAPGGQTVRHTHVGTGAGHMSMLTTDGNGTVGAGQAGGLTATTDNASRQATMASIVLPPA